MNPESITNSIRASPKESAEGLDIGTETEEELLNAEKKAEQRMLSGINRTSKNEGSRSTVRLDGARAPPKRRGSEVHEAQGSLPEKEDQEPEAKGGTRTQLGRRSPLDRERPSSSSGCFGVRTEATKAKRDRRGRSESGERREKKRKRRRSSSSRSTNSSARRVFRATSGSGEKMSQATMIRWTEKNPGLSAAHILQQMEDTVGRDGDRGKWKPTDCPASAKAYYIRYLKHENTHQVRNHREMRTLCTVLDHLARDRPREAADVIAHRLKAVEMASRDNGWSQANFVELIPAVAETLTTRDELLVVLCVGGIFNDMASPFCNSEHT